MLDDPLKPKANPVIQSLFQGKWQSHHHSIAIRFNQNVWQEVEDGFDTPEGILLGLFSANDGASFSFNYQRKRPGQRYDYQFSENEYFARLYNLDNQCQKKGQSEWSISTLNWIVDFYEFQNKKFGLQTVARAMRIGNKEVMSIGLAWPADHRFTPSAPPKIQLLLDHLSIQTPDQ